MKNNKILRLALQNATPNVDALLTVVEATENPETAIEILMGVYEAPSIRPNSNKERINARYPKNAFVSFNPIANKVTFTYNRHTTAHGWFRKDGPAEMACIFSEASYNDKEKAFADYCKKFNLELTMQEFDKICVRKEYIVEIYNDLYTEDCSLDEWQTPDWEQEYQLSA